MPDPGHLFASPDDVHHFIVFFVPGFISILIGGMIGSVPDTDLNKRVTAALGYSAINYAAYSTLIAILAYLGLTAANAAIEPLFIFVFPIGYPYIVHELRQRQLFNFSTPYPSVWDQLFSRRGLQYFVRARLKGDTEEYVYGFYGKGSISSQTPADPIIYLERVYNVDNDGNWHQRKDVVGLLLPMNECRSLEFIIPEANQ